jgi:putative transposase
MVISGHIKLSIRRQCQLLMLNRSSYYKKPRGEKVENIRVMKRIDEVYLKHPCYGSRRMMHILNQEGVRISRHRVRRLMQIMGIQAIYQQPRTSLKAPEHKVYPYLLKNLTIERSNHVWCSDITYVPMRRGFMYLTAIMDWYSRKVLSWRLSNTLDTRFCLESLEEAIGIYGKPDIFNTDQGAQYTSQAFTGSLEKNGIQISMDGKGRWVDNVMIERLWRSVKYECLYLQEFDDIRGLNNTLQAWIDFYNKERPHSTFNGRTPSDVYYENLQKLAA